MTKPKILAGRESTVFIADDVECGEDVSLAGFNNLYGCRIGAHTRIGTFVEIQKGVVIGENCKISSHTFICEGVTIEEGCFIGHGVMFINDRTPAAVKPDGNLKTDKDWVCERTHVRKGANIGSGAVIMCGVNIGRGALVGAGAVVTHDVAARSTVVGVPARVLIK